jgi:hypothetical protein
LTGLTSRGMRRSLVSIAVAILALIGAWGARADTTDRLPGEAMLKLVEGPVKTAESGDLAAADRQFQAQLAAVRKAKGENSVEAADQLNAMGVALQNRGSERSRPDMMRAAVPYLRSGVEAARRAWGPRHPEVALALVDYAEGTHSACPDPLPEDLVSSMAEAYAIRYQSLGPLHPETRATGEQIQWVKKSCTPAQPRAEPPTVESNSVAELGEPPTLDQTLKGSGRLRGSAFPPIAYLDAFIITLAIGGICLGQLQRRGRLLIGTIAFVMAGLAFAAFITAGSLYDPQHESLVAQIQKSWDIPSALMLSGFWAVLWAMTAGLVKVARPMTPLNQFFSWVGRRRGLILTTVAVFAIGAHVNSLRETQRFAIQNACLRNHAAENAPYRECEKVRVVWATY